LARERPLQRVLALTPHLTVARRLALAWGLEPRVMDQPLDLDDMTDKAAELAVRIGLAQPGQRLIILAGVPFGTPGATNLLRLAYAPR
jgi:pyruvate kinase